MPARDAHDRGEPQPEFRRAAVAVGFPERGLGHHGRGRDWQRNGQIHDRVLEIAAEVHEPRLADGSEQPEAGESREHPTCGQTEQRRLAPVLLVRGDAVGRQPGQAGQQERRGRAERGAVEQVLPAKAADPLATL